MEEGITDKGLNNTFSGFPHRFYYQKQKKKGVNFLIITELLDGLKQVKGTNGQYTAKCPAHDDHRNSLSVTEGEDGRILLHCHAGCTPETILAAMHLDMKDLYPSKEERNAAKTGRSEKGSVTEEYVYYDSDSTPILKKLRLQFHDRKEFRWQHFDGCRWRYGRNGIDPPLYNQNAMANDGQIFVVEGEKDVLTMKRMGLTAVSLADGASSRWREEYGPLFHGKEVFILPDNDAPGWKYASMLAENIYRFTDHIKILDLKRKWKDIPDKGDISDVAVTVGDQEAILGIAWLADHTEGWQPQPIPGSRYSAVSADSFGEDNTRFIWYPFIPAGDYTVLMAEGGAGKTMFCCGIAASISRGEQLPGDTFNTVPAEGNVLFITAEDRGELLKKRLQLSGAVLSRIFILDCMASEGLNFCDRMDRFLKLVKEVKPCLVIIDPWHAFLGAGVDINRVNALRPVLQKLANVAKVCECGMILISHVNKRAQGENANNAAIGSADLINASRSAMKVVRCDEPGKKDLRVVVHTKSNYAPEGKSILYNITNGGGVRWAGFSDISRSVLEASSRVHLTPFEYLENRQNEEEEKDALADAIRKLAREGETVNISYREMEEKFGDTIFGSTQPKKILDSLIGPLSREGIILKTGKSVKYQKRACNGFSVTRKAFETDPDSVA